MFRASNNTGFTIVELVVVIIILGIISAVAAPRFFDLQDYKKVAFKDELVSALRFAQKRAVASGKKVEVSIDANGFSLRYADGTAVQHPTGDHFTNTESPPVAMADQTILFDALGRADKSGSTDTETKFTHVGYDNSGITIWRETGCVEVD